MKMNKKRPILRRAAIPAVLALLCTLFWFGKPNDFGLGRNMELLVNMMRELSLFYVDEVDPDQLMQDAAEGMTRNLDPYTEFLPEEQMSNFDLLTTGKYGGIGSMIRKKGDYVIFAQPYEGSPADRAGIRIGDKILSIEGEDTKGWDPAQISSALKGTPNTTVRIVIERLIGGGHDTLTLTRERVAIPSVPYAGFVAKGIGYIQHSDFTEGSYEEMRTAIEKLRTQDTLRGLILDYRGNGGGILQEAVKIVSMFVPKGTEVVRTKGRAATQENVFRTANDPILPDLPLAVLINGNSASAAEIVAGSLQDLDRAVLIGQKSFGKGLVQTTRPLGYNTLLKLTTAKYYIPSATCSLLVATSPIMTAIIASKVYREKIGPVSWISIFIAFSGVMILLLWDSHGTFSIDVAMLWMLLSAASWAGYNIMTRKLVAMGYTSAQITCFSMLGAALWLCFSAMQGFREMVTGEPKHFLALLYLAIISNAVGCILWAKALAYAEKTSEVANFMFLSPLLSTLMSFLLLHEVPGMGTFVGGAIIICGLLLFNLKGQKKE